MQLQWWQQHGVRGHVREGRLQGAHPRHLHLRRLQGGRQGQLRGLLVVSQISGHFT